MSLGGWLGMRKTTMVLNGSRGSGFVRFRVKADGELELGVAN